MGHKHRHRQEHTHTHTMYFFLIFFLVRWFVVSFSNTTNKCFTSIPLCWNVRFIYYYMYRRKICAHKNNLLLRKSYLRRREKTALTAAKTNALECECTKVCAYCVYVTNHFSSPLVSRFSIRFVNLGAKFIKFERERGRKFAVKKQFGLFLYVFVCVVCC